MPKYAYQAMAQGGEAMAGTIEAASPEHAQRLLAAMQVKVYSLSIAPKEPPRTRLGRSEFLLFNQQLAAITKAGLPLEKALRQTAGDVQSGRLRRAIGELASDLEGGLPLEQAFARHERSFPYLYGQIIKAGVQTGRLSEMLTSLNRHLEMAGETRRILLDALTYPLLVFGMAMAVFTAILAFVVPQFIDLYKDWRSHLPPATELLFWISEHIWRIWIVLGGTAAVVIVVGGILGASPAGRRWREIFLLRVPVVGRVYHRTNLARLCDALAILVASGCQFPTAIRLAGGASGSPNLRAECDVMAQAVEAGQSLDPNILSLEHVPAVMIYSMRLGSQRNDLESNLYSLSDMYSTQARHLQTNLHALLLPCLIVGVGVFVGFSISALFGPLFWGLA